MNHPAPEDLLYNTRTVREWVSFSRTHSILWQTVFNGASVWSKTRLDVDQNDMYVGLRVPAGYRVVMFDRILEITSGRFTVDVLAGDWEVGPTSEQMLVGPLRSSAFPLVPVSTAFLDVTPVGPNVVIEEGYFQAPAGDSASKPAASFLNTEGAIKIFDGQDGEATAMLRLRRLAPSGGGVVEPYDMNIKYLAWEESLV